MRTYRDRYGQRRTQAARNAQRNRARCVSGRAGVGNAGGCCMAGGGCAILLLRMLRGMSCDMLVPIAVDSIPERCAR